MKRVLWVAVVAVISALLTLIVGTVVLVDNYPTIEAKAIAWQLHDQGSIETFLNKKRPAELTVEDKGYDGKCLGKPFQKYATREAAYLAYYETLNAAEVVRKPDDDDARLYGSILDYECFFNLNVDDLIEQPLSYEKNRVAYALDYYLRLNILNIMVNDNNLNCQIYYKIPKYIESENNYETIPHARIEDFISTTQSSIDSICNPHEQNAEYYLIQKNRFVEKYNLTVKAKAQTKGKDF